MPARYHRETLRRWLAVPCLALLGSACSGGDVDLGEVNRDLAGAGSLCRYAPVATGRLLVENQEQLNALAGCEVINGDLRVRPFEGVDFRPLASLRAVRGTLELGSVSSAVRGADGVELPSEARERQAAIIDGGWLRSFTGLEALETAGSLVLRGISAASLEPFSNLEVLGDGGVLAIGPCTGLRDLSGLGIESGLIDLALTCASLESLAGLAFPARMGDVSLRDCSRLTDLAALGLEAVGDLHIENTGLESLDGLSRLTSADGIELVGNPSLIDISGLDALRSLQGLRVASNPRLQRLPAFPSLASLRSLSVVFNDALTTLGSFPALVPESELIGSWEDIASRDAIRYRADVIEITDNPLLRRVSMPRGWHAASYVEVGHNDQLESIDLAGLHAVDRLALFENAVLRSVDLGALTTVDDLRVVDNPLLPLIGFAGLRTFESVLSAGPITDPSAP